MTDPPEGSAAGRPGLDLGRLDHLAALVVPTVRTDAMWKLLLVAVWTGREPDLRERIVSTALVSTGLRMASFGVRHLVYLLFQFQ